jgi:hypothetical protein
MAVALPVHVWQFVMQWEEPHGFWCGCTLRAVSRGFARLAVWAAFHTTAGTQWLFQHVFPRRGWRAALPWLWGDACRDALRCCLTCKPERVFGTLLDVVQSDDSELFEALVDLAADTAYVELLIRTALHHNSKTCLERLARHSPRMDQLVAAQTAAFDWPQQHGDAELLPDGDVHVLAAAAIDHDNDQMLQELAERRGWHNVRWAIESDAHPLLGPRCSTLLFRMWPYAFVVCDEDGTHLHNLDVDSAELFLLMAPNERGVLLVGAAAAHFHARVLQCALHRWPRAVDTVDRALSVLSSCCTLENIFAVLSPQHAESMVAQEWADVLNLAVPLDGFGTLCALYPGALRSATLWSYVCAEYEGLLHHAEVLRWVLTHGCVSVDDLVPVLATIPDEPPTPLKRALAGHAYTWDVLVRTVAMGHRASAAFMATAMVPERPEPPDLRLLLQAAVESMSTSTFQWVLAQFGGALCGLLSPAEKRELLRRHATFHRSPPLRLQHALLFSC